MKLCAGRELEFAEAKPLSGALTLRNGPSDLQVAAPARPIKATLFQRPVEFGGSNDSPFRTSVASKRRRGQWEFAPWSLSSSSSSPGAIDPESCGMGSRHFEKHEYRKAGHDAK